MEIGQRASRSGLVAALFSLLAWHADGARAAPGASAAAEEETARAARDRAGEELLRGDAEGAARDAAACLAQAGAPGAAGTAQRKDDPELAGDCALELGRARFQLGQLAEAAEVLGRARAQFGALEAHGAKLLGEALLLSGRAREAEAPLRDAEALEPEGPAGQAAAALLADALFDAGDPSAAAGQAQRAAALPGQPLAVRAGLAWTRVQSLAQLARSSEAADAGTSLARAQAARAAGLAARELWLDFPDHPAAAEEPALELALAQIAGGPLPEPSARDRLTRASRLLGAGQPAPAALEAKAALALAVGDARAEASLLLARALAADGRRGEAGPLLADAARSSQPRVAAAAMLLLARDRSRRAENAEAFSLLDQLAARFPLSSEADEGALLAARLQLDEGNPGDAKARLARIAGRRTASAADARWTLAWLAYRARQPDAAERFAACAALAGDDESRARALYWQARASPAGEAAPLLRRVLALDPLGWYGLLARSPPAAGAARASTDAANAQGAAEVRAPASSAAVPSSSTSLLARALERLADPARRLLRIGFSAEAAAELELAARAAHGDAVRLLPILAGYQRAGRYDRSVLLAESLLAGRPAPLQFRAPGAAAAPDATLRALLEAAYPQAFPDAIAASARRSGLDPDFILAIARRESVFKPDARSAAGAVGLLQLLPVTARRAAAVLGRPAPSDKDLLEPAVAADLGAWYLAELLGRFRDPAVAVAAYNAGPRAVAPWAKSGLAEPLDVWVEEIPFKETRRYVKIVIGAWSAYRLLEGKAAPTLSATVPEVAPGTAF